MSKTFAHLKKAVAAFATRDEDAFVRDGFNSLERAINDAHQWAQRKHVFERAKVFIDVNDVSLANGADLSTAVLRGTDTAVKVRSLIAGFVQLTDGSGEVPVDIITRESWVASQKRKYNGLPNATDNAADYEGPRIPLSIVQYGTTVYLSTTSPAVVGSSSTINLRFDAVRWFDDYTAPDDTDFFLDYCFDFMTFRSVYQLNLYLKEDQRVPIAKSVLDDSWDSVVRWDSSLLFNATNDNDL